MEPNLVQPEVIPLLAQLGTAIAANFATDGLRAFLTKEEEGIARSIRTIAGRFPEAEGAEVALEQWTQSDGFRRLFERLHAGERDIEQDEVIRSFVEEGGFYQGPEREEAQVAAQLVVAIFAEMLALLFRGDEALPALANRLETLHADAKSEIASQFDSLGTELEDKFARLQSSIETAGLLAEPTEPGSFADPRHNEIVKKIDFARDLINRGLADTAREDLEQLTEQADELPKELRFRIFTNLGAALLAAEDTLTAAGHLEHAHRIQPDNPKGIANAAIAARIRKDSERAIELAVQAREAVAENSQATAVLLDELWEAERTDDLETLISTEPWLWGDRNCGITLATIRLRQSRFPEAVALCRTLAAANPEDAGVHLTLGQCLLKQAQAGLQLTGTITEASFAQLRSAETALLRAAERLDSTQLRTQKHDALVALANTHSLLGLPTEAMAELNRVLSESPSHPDANFMKGLLLLDKGEPAEARLALESSLEDRGEDVLGPLAGACIDSGDPIAAVNLLKGSFSLAEPEWEDVYRAILLNRAEANSGGEDSVGPAIEAALADRPNNARLLTLAAAHSDLNGSQEEAERLLLEARKQGNERDRREVSTRLAALYQRNGRFAEAADLLAEVVNDAPSHPAAGELLICLVNSQRLRDALAWAREIRKAQPHLPRLVIEAEARILERAGDTLAAIERLKELCSHVDSTAVDQVSLAAAQFRGGMPELACETIREIPIPELCADPMSLLRLAQLQLLLGEGGALDTALLVYRCGPDAPEAHLGYLGLFLACEASGPDPEAVSAGCAVLLKDELKEHWYLLLEDEETPRTANELKPAHPLATRLMGARVGDSIVLRQDLEDLSYDVVAIQSKFTRAFQEIHEEFSTRFPDHKGLSRVTGGDEGLAKVLTTIEQRDQFASEAERMYREGRLPFASFCSLLGRSALEGWRACTESRSIPIRCSAGTDEEASTASESLLEADGIILDPLALLTAHRLGLAAVIQDRFSHVAVPQLVIEEIQEAYYNTVLGPAPSGYLGKDADGRYALTEMTNEEWEQQRDFVRSVLSFAESLERLPSYRLLDESDAENLVEMLSWAGAGAVYAGEPETSAKLVLVSDDLGLASVARHLGVEVVNTQAVLSELRRAGVITAQDYFAQIESLVLLNYRFVRVDAATILGRLEANGYVTTDGTRAMVETLEGPECSDESAVSVAAELMVELARRAPDKVGLILGSVIEVLQSGRQGRPVPRMLASAVEARLSRDPVTSSWLVPAVLLHIAVSEGHQ